MNVAKNIEVLNNFSKICRLCLNFGEMKNLEEYKYVLKCINIEIELVGNLPDLICLKCVNFLQNVFNFIESLKTNEAYLHDIFLKQTLKPESPDESKTDDCFPDSVISEDESNCPSMEIKKPYMENFKLIKANNDIIPHYQENNSEKHTCKVCGKQFLRLGGLNRHKKIHLGIKPFKCEKCNKTFQEKLALTRHLLIHTGEKPYECNLCGIFTRRKDQVISHIQKQHPTTTDYSSFITHHDSGQISIQSDVKVSAEEYLHNENNSQTKKRVEICLCTICGKVFRRRGYLKNHMAIHAKIKPFRCNICEKSFTQRHVLIRHNLVHTKERPFQCNLCGKTFTRKEILCEHLKNHDGSKSFLCFHCGKSFSNKEYLAKHLKYYLSSNEKNTTLEEKCVCPKCGKNLHSTSYLKTHLLTHTGEKPYICNICGKRFTVQRTLKSHINIHKGIKPYQCLQCEKCFRTSNSLRKHGLLHTGDRPYKCSSCDKGFIRRSHLKRHLRIH